MKNKFGSQRWFFVTAVFMLLTCYVTRGQFYDSSSGLLSMPSADMNPSGTFMITNNLINENTIS